MDNTKGFSVISANCRESDFSVTVEQSFKALGIKTGSGLPVEQLPFTGEDITAGSETELQAVVIGNSDNVDLPLAIRDSRAFVNLKRRIQSGEAPQHRYNELHEFIHDSNHQVWENSWVRFPRNKLSRYAETIFKQDLLADKAQPEKGLRSDAKRFQFNGPKEKAWVRVPVSYLIKLALADLLGNQQHLHKSLIETGETLLSHYLNDNSSPETISFHVSILAPKTGMGRSLAKETAKRYLFTQLLIRYANLKFGLLEAGQEARVYFAPHSPLQQKKLNNMIPDAFYRHLFMSPCLSGWDQGEEKHSYMQLCHQVLSRSQLNAVAKLREAGIITNNLVVLPNVSNTSLANNGVHISLGSKVMTEACRNQRGEVHEKYLGDLATKIMEHFLPLFVTTYSAAPYRLAFSDFHPEQALGVLSHELDFTHLRMLWRRWKKKASLSLFGHRLTPFGPRWIDGSLSCVFRMRGDLVPDFRLLDYPVAFLSTEQSPAYNGKLGNQEQLKADLADMGIVDRQMSLYQFIKLREFSKMGFSGFEGRHYSLFPDLDQDLSGATNLQVLLTALAFKYMASGAVSHRHIPDTPFVESERRQIFFSMAIGIPTFFVLRKTRNRFLLKILKKTERIRTSHRYPGYLRIYRQDYCRALLAVLQEDAKDLIEMFNFNDLLDDLKLRIEQPRQYSAIGKLIGGITNGSAEKPININADAFNHRAEEYYREKLRRQHIEKSLALLQEDLLQMDKGSQQVDKELRPQLETIMGGHGAPVFLTAAKNDLLYDRLGFQPLVRLLGLMLLAEQRDRLNNQDQSEQEQHGTDTPIHRAL